jgi:hypothetical protein
LFTYISGQISPIVGLWLLLGAWMIARRMETGFLLPVAIFMATLKPNIVFLPVFLCLVEVVRRRRWKTLSYVLLLASLAAVFAFLTNPHWVPDLIGAWRNGDYLGGKPGLAASGYSGIVDFGVPVWIFLPLILYLLYRWKKDGFTYGIIALAVMVNFLVFPYSRRYDYVLFILPGCILVRDISLKNWMPIGLAILGLLIIPFTDLSLLSPLLITIGLLLKPTVSEAVRASQIPLRELPIPVNGGKPANQ